MKLISCGTSGTSAFDSKLSWTDLDLEEMWQQVIQVIQPETMPRSLQVLALQEHRILEHRQNLIISAPTNSGKSLVGLLVLLDAVHRGRRALLLEPLRALAREKVDELQRLIAPLSTVFGQQLSVRISTGDYRLEDELLSDPPPGGEIVVATPERIEALLRNPDNLKWLETLGAVCVDEAHLISSSQRGLTLEYLITSLLGLPVPPRLVLLSATLGNIERAQSWLSPCDVVRMTERQPPLEKWVIEVEKDEDANTIALDQVTEQLQEPSAQVLVFVYQTRSTQHLAKLLSQRLRDQAGEAGALAYHSQMSQQQREQVRQSFVAGQSRVIVTTTALALGINLPATHVFIRDNTFPGAGKLEASELLQMMGRAGRGERSGQAFVLVKPGDDWQVEELVSSLRLEELPSLESAPDRELNRSAKSGDMPAIAPQVAALLSRWQEQGATLEELRAFLVRSLGGQALVSQLRATLNWLESHLLVYREPEQNRYHLTVLGKKATQAVLPLPIAAGYARLIRDLMSVDPQDELLGQWRSLDHLLVLDLLSERSPNLRRHSAKLVQQVESWCEAHPTQTPLLFRKWIWGQVGSSRAAEIMGSLGLQAPKAGKGKDEWAHRIGYGAMLRVIILWERSQGVRLEEVERQFSIQGLEGIEERWRDDQLWLLSGLAKLLDVRTFYYHLREDCQADFQRVKRVKRYLKQMEQQIYDLREQLKYCSPLGSLLCEIRRLAPRDKPRIGFQSIRKLEEAGIFSLKELMPLKVEDLVNLGIQRRLAGQVRAYLRRRMQ